MVQHSRKLLFLFLCASGTVVADLQNKYGAIAGSYLTSFPAIEENGVNEVKDAKTGKQTFAPHYLSKDEARRKVFGLLAHHGKSREGNNEVVLNKNAWSDLELFVSNGEKKSESVFSKINRTHTLFGEATLANMLVSPQCDVKAVIENQEKLKSLVTNDLLLEQLDKVISSASSHELPLLNIYKEMDDIQKEFFSSLYFKSNFFKGLNKNTVALEAWTRLGQLNFIKLATDPITFYPFLVATHIIGTRLGRFVGKYFDIPVSIETENAASAALTTGFEHYSLIFSKETFESLKKHLQNKETVKKFLVAGIPMVGIGCFYLSKVYEGIARKYSEEKDNIAKAKYLQTHCIGLANYLAEIKRAVALLAADSSAKVTFKSTINYLEALMDAKGAQLSQKLNNVIKLLSTSTFKGDASAFSLTGRVLAAYTLLEEVKSELIPLFEAFGEIDAYVSLAKLYKEREGKNASFTFVNFVDSAKPALEIQNFWNPLVDANSVVTNSISLGVTSPQNAIITGPNAGGKSTVITGLSLAVLFAHSFGMVPAKTCTMTPFTYLNTYLNIADDRAAGKSLFKAEVERADTLYKSIQALKGKRFSFTIMDELFSGTNAVEGEAAAYSVAKSLGAFRNSICLLATHFPKITELEKATKSFKNYKVSVIKHDNGYLEYPYVLEEGITNQAIALDVLRQQGFSSSILEDAYAIVGTNKSF